MIEPMLAPVRPRVILPEIHEAIPLDDVLPDLQAGSARAIEIVGDSGSGKTTALAHLAALVQSGAGFAFLDNAPLDRIAEAVAKGAVVVFTSRHASGLLGATSYRLASWGDNELLEYLLAAHPARCHSVMARLKAATDRNLPRGLAELWRVVLDNMARDESLTGVSEALRCALQQALPSDKSRSLAEENSLAALTGRLDEAAERYCRTPPDGIDIRTFRLLRYEPVQLLLAADYLKRLIETQSGQDRLAARLPYRLVELVAAELSSAAVETLRIMMTKGPAACQAMAASLLHAADGRWIPAGRPLPLLAGAYLAAAAWDGVDLSKARLEAADLSQSDLTEATLSGRGRKKPSSAMRSCAAHCSAKYMPKAPISRAQSSPPPTLPRPSLTAPCFGGQIWRTQISAGPISAGQPSTAHTFQRPISPGPTLSALSIDRADFSSADLQGACLNRLPLRKANFTGSGFSNAQLIECDIEGIRLPGADFEKAHLRGSLLTGCAHARGQFRLGRPPRRRSGRCQLGKRRPPPGGPAGMYLPSRLGPQRTRGQSDRLRGKPDGILRRRVRPADLPSAGRDPQGQSPRRRSARG